MARPLIYKVRMSLSAEDRCYVANLEVGHQGVTADGETPWETLHQLADAL